MRLFFRQKLVLVIMATKVPTKLGRLQWSHMDWTLTLGVVGTDAGPTEGFKHSIIP